MHPEVEELRPRLKEILYDCAVDIRATKAALFLFDGTSRFELVTEYGFRGTIRTAADANDPMVDRCGRGRTPFFVNGVGVEPRFSEILFQSSTDRLLGVPLYSRGKLIGFVDMRDKAGKQPFEPADVTKAQQIADRLVELVADKNVFGHRFITLSNMTGHYAPAALPGDARQSNVSPDAPIRELPNAVAKSGPATAAAAAPAPAPVAAPQPKPVRQSPRANVPGLASLILEARTISSRIPAASPAESFGELDLAGVREVLRSILLIPGAIAAAFSAFEQLGGVQEIASRSALADDARTLLQSKLNAWLSRRGEGGGALRTEVLMPFGTNGPMVTAADVQKVFTAPLAVSGLRAMYLTVAFAGNPERTSHELLTALHAHLQLVIEQSIHRNALSSLRIRVAESLIEPDLLKYTALRRHAERVSSLAESFARHLGLTPAEVENARIVGLVHDVGMRLLDYDRLYDKRDLTEDELAFMREHPSVGAAIVERVLGPEVARAVLCHHERVDGRGYPNQLQGEEIPLLSRVVQICDAFVAMSDPDSYQASEPVASAVATIERSAGSQFDAALAPRFVELMSR